MNAYAHPRKREFRARELAGSVHWAQRQKVPRLAGDLRRLYDFEFFLVRSGEVAVAFEDGVECRCGPGDLLLLASHLSHRISVPSEEGASVTGVHFDFYGEFAVGDYPDIVVREDDGDRERFCYLPVDGSGEWILPRRLSSVPMQAAALLDRIVDVFGARLPGFELVCRGLLLQLIGELVGGSYARRGDDAALQEHGGNAAPSALAAAAGAAAERMLADVGAPWQVGVLAREMNVSEDYFIRLFKKSTGSTPYRFLQYARFREAQRLLRDTQQPISDVGLAVGFADIHHFSQFFKRWQGVSPHEYRRLCSML